CGIVTVDVCQLERLVVDQENDAILRCHKSVQADLRERLHHVILSITSSHPAGELVHVEIVAPGADLAVTDLEGSHDRQLERLPRELEDVDPLGHHDRTICCNVDDAKLDALDG